MNYVSRFIYEGYLSKTEIRIISEMLFLQQSLFKVLCTFGAVIFATLLIKWVSPLIKVYLINDTSLHSLPESGGAIIVLIMFAALLALVLFLIVSICKMWILLDKSLGKAVFGGSMLIIIWSLSGGVMYSLNLFDLFYLHGFDSLGIYTLLIILIISSTFMYRIIQYLLSR
jgi:hypothetical protein